jgi:ABC-type multidrug transport system fused ATPase/permease subunit
VSAGGTQAAPVIPGAGGAWATWRIVPRLFPYLRPYRGLVLASLGLSALAVAVGLAHPWPLALMVDSVLGQHAAPRPLTHLLGTQDRTVLLAFAAGASLVLAVLTNATTVVHEYVNTKLEQRLVLDFRSDMFWHAQRLSVDYHDRRPTGQLMNQLLNEADNAGTLITALLPLGQSAVTLVGMFVIAFGIDRELALLSLTVIPFVYYSVGHYSRRIVPRLRHVRGLEWQSASIIFESMAMLRVVAAFAREPYEFTRFRSQGEIAADARVGITVRQTLFSLVVNTCTATGTALVLAVGALHVREGRLTVGEVLVLLSYIGAVYQPLETISSTIGLLQQQLVSVQGAFLLLDLQPEIADAPRAVALERTRGAIEFRDVRFSYRERDETLRDITFRVEPGQHVALVGPTGAGKTTLASLLTRFYDPDDGVVLLDGTDVRTLTIRSLRGQISLVLQVPQLFSGTIAENIRYGRLDATQDEVVAAARAANAHEFIAALPQAYDTELGEGGAQLSVGERQRICIARAFLKDAPILILDEPTSAIDSRTEGVILDALDELMVGRTTVMIAHRLSTIRHADLILVMDGGRIVERGTHEELLAVGGLYKELHDAQTTVRRRSARVADAPPPPAQPAPAGPVSDGVRMFARAARELLEDGSSSALLDLAARDGNEGPDVEQAAELARALLDDVRAGADAQEVWR